MLNSTCRLWLTSQDVCRGAPGLACAPSACQLVQATPIPARWHVLWLVLTCACQLLLTSQNVCRGAPGLACAPSACQLVQATPIPAGWHVLWLVLTCSCQLVHITQIPAGLCRDRDLLTSAC